MKKRALSLLLALMLCLSLIPAAVFAEGEGETYPYEAPKLRVMEEDGTVGNWYFKKGVAMILDVPDGPVNFNATITNKATNEVYEQDTDGFANRVVQTIHIGYDVDKAMASGTYTISVYFMDDAENQISPVAEVDYEYTYPGKFDTPANAKWIEDGDFDWTLPDDVTENDEVFVRFGKKQENGEIKIIGRQPGPANDTTRFLERFIERVNREGEGDYCFSVRVLSDGIAERFHSDWSEWSETRHIDPVGDGLKDSIEKIDSTNKATAVEAVRGLNTNNLATSMAADNEGTGVVGALAELETKLGLEATVENKADSGLDVGGKPIKVVGAGFNTTDNTKPTLTISKVDEELAIPNDGYVNNNLIQVDLSLGEKVATDTDGKLPVPIRITMPVPAGMNHEYLRILHYSENKTFDREIRPYTYQEDGVWMASFVVTHLNPFVFIEAAQNGGDDPSGTTFTVTFNANGGTVSPATATTGADGKLASLPTPTRSGYTFNGWFTAADGGESVTTATVFTENTTAYAHWTASSSGTGGSGGSGGSGNSGGSTPAKPTTPTEPEKPTTPSVPVIDASEKFADVAKDAWYVQDVSYAVSHGLMNGTGGKFEPNALLSRAMLAQILYNHEGNPAVSSIAPFSDASGGWYADAVAWAAANGIVNGNSDGSFNPNGAITREQVAVILYRFAQSLGIDVSARGDLSAFADSAGVSNYAAEAMAWATACGLINGSNGRLDPAGSATRAQAAAILHRFCENVIK